MRDFGTRNNATESETDYDTIHDLANHHEVVRGILGVHTRRVFESGKYLSLQSIKDNVALLDESTLKHISDVVVKADHERRKKTKVLN